MSPLGYQAPIVKASWCGNERQERSGSRKVGCKDVGKNLVGDRLQLSEELLLVGVDGADDGAQLRDVALQRVLKHHADGFLLVINMFFKYHFLH